MSKIVYDSNTLKIMSLFETVTRTSLKDCIHNEGEMVFIVNAGDAGKAVGSKGKNVRTLEHSLRTRIKITEYSDNPVSFIKNLIYPLQAAEVESVNETLVIKTDNGKTRSLLIGRNANRLRAFEAIVQRYFPIKEIKIN